MVEFLFWSGFYHSDIGCALAVILFVEATNVTAIEGIRNVAQAIAIGRVVGKRIVVTDCDKFEFVVLVLIFCDDGCLVDFFAGEADILAHVEGIGL